MKRIMKIGICGLCVLVLLHSLVIFLPIDHIWELPFHIWADYISNRMEIPSAGEFVCGELDMSVSFDGATKLTFPDGNEVMIAIDYGGNIFNLYEDAPRIRGSYAAYLDDGYIEFCFEELPIPVKEEKAYRFYLQVND